MKEDIYPMKDIHIGNIIRERLKKSPLSITEFAERINRTRPTVYDIFERKSIDVDLLMKISEVLDYNFLQEVYLNQANKKAPSTPPAERYIVGFEVPEADVEKYLGRERCIVLKVVR